MTKLVYEITDLDFPLQLWRESEDLFRVVYGKHIKDSLTYSQAAKEFGECLMHNLTCAGRLDTFTEDPPAN